MADVKTKAPILERLRETGPNIVYPGNVLRRNPDGPEAADVIERLQAALADVLNNPIVRTAIGDELYTRYAELSTGVTPCQM